MTRARQISGPWSSSPPDSGARLPLLECPLPFPPFRDGGGHLIHEYSIVDALLRKIEAEARAHGATSVTRVELRIGELAGVERDLLGFAFEAYREGTVCAGATLQIHPVAARWECPACGTGRKDAASLRCPACDKPLRLAEGDDIILERLEMEVPDVS
ncbi:MAG: hydrogenase maturation nickel metallochaperone HypA [Thermoanaerobaculia bacterium]